MTEGVEVYEGDGHCPAIDAIIKREEDVAKREAAVEAREKAVAERERQVAEREARNPEAMQKIMELIEALKQRQQGGINDNDQRYPWKHEPARWPANPGINDVPFYGPGTVYRSDDKLGPLLSSPPNSGTVGPLPASGGGTIVSTTVTAPTFGSAGLAAEDRETMSKLRDLLNQVCGIGGVQINASLPAASAPIKIKTGNFLAKILGKESP